jgi:hypothetical protein
MFHYTKKINSFLSIYCILGIILLIYLLLKIYFHLKVKLSVFE